MAAWFSLMKKNPKKIDQIKNNNNSPTPFNAFKKCKIFVEELLLTLANRKYLILPQHF
jgi:hypothetical protein